MQRIWEPMRGQLSNKWWKSWPKYEKKRTFDKILKTQLLLAQVTRGSQTVNQLSLGAPSRWISKLMWWKSVEKSWSFWPNCVEIVIWAKVVINWRYLNPETLFDKSKDQLSFKTTPRTIQKHNPWGSVKKSDGFCPDTLENQRVEKYQKTSLFDANQAY